MTAKILRGRLLSFVSRPADRDDTKSYFYEEDGALLIAEGRIAATGSFREIQEEANRNNIAIAGYDQRIDLKESRVAG